MIFYKYCWKYNLVLRAFTEYCLALLCLLYTLPTWVEGSFIYYTYQVISEHTHTDQNPKLKFQVSEMWAEILFALHLCVWCISNMYYINYVCSTIKNLTIVWIEQDLLSLWYWTLQLLVASVFCFQNNIGKIFLTFLPVVSALSMMGCPDNHTFDLSIFAAMIEKTDGEYLKKSVEDGNKG